MNNRNFSRLIIRLKYGNALKPQRDWFILLAIAGILFVLSVLINTYIFIRVAHGEQLSDEVIEPTQQMGVDTAKLDAADAVFRARAKTSSVYAADPHFIDPSR